MEKEKVFMAVSLIFEKNHEEKIVMNYVRGGAGFL